MAEPARQLLPAWTAALVKGQLYDADDMVRGLRSQLLLQQDGCWTAGGQAPGGKKAQPVAGPFLDAVTQAAGKATVRRAAARGGRRGRR